MILRVLLILAAGSSGLRGQVFEVASVRPHSGPAVRSGPLTVSDPLIRLEGYTVFGLVMDAYNLQPYQLTFGRAVHPEEIAGAMYDIVARTPGGGMPRIDDVRAMLRNLMAERFHLGVHREQRNVSLCSGGGTKRTPAH